MNIRFVLAGLLLLGFASNGSAADGDYNKALRIGDSAPVWEALEGIDGRRHSLDDLKDKDVVVVFFTCNDCVVAKEYEQRFIDFTSAYAKPGSKVAVVAVSLFNHGERDSLESMKKRATEKGFNFQYIIDPTQRLGKRYGATVTPDVFVLDRDRKVMYMGAFDDDFTGAKLRNNYATDAVDALLKKKVPPVLQTKSFGCPIRYLQR